MLQHFEQIRMENPFNTKAIIILPRCKDSEMAKSRQPFLKKYRLIHTYPEGSYPFHTATEPMKTLPMPPTSWDVDVFLADSTVEERETQLANDCMITTKLKTALASLGNKRNKPKNYKPHQPRFEVSKEYISTVNDSDLLILNPTIQPHSLLKFTTMLDSGATKCFIDDIFCINPQTPHTPTATPNTNCHGRRSCCSSLSRLHFTPHIRYLRH
jgi:hypothetical protein